MESASALHAQLQAQRLLSASDKAGLLRLVCKALDPVGHEFESVATPHGINIYRSTPSPGGPGIYRVSGMGHVEESAQVVFELLTHVPLVGEFDMLFKGARLLSWAQKGGCGVGYVHLVYGLPGCAHLVSDRDFVLRVVRAAFPGTGVHALYCRSIGAGEAPVHGDPGPQRRMIRGHMSDSGYVVVPARGGCSLTITLQVDPKGWVPTPVVNLALESIPLNIERVRSVLARLPRSLLQQLPELNRQQAARCHRLPPAESLGPAGAALHAAAAAAGGGGTQKQHGAGDDAWAGSGGEEQEDDDEPAEWYDA